MKIRKRIKINLPDHPTARDGIDVKKLNKPNFSLLQEDLDDDEDHGEVHIGALKKKKSRGVEDLPPPDQEAPRYNDIFSKKPTSRVLNLEDMADDDDMAEEDDDNQESTGFPSKKHIEDLKRAKLSSQKASEHREKVNEKIYVSLLDDDDKLEIMETIKKNGGPDKAQGPPSDPDIDMLDDERLPLSSREHLLQNERRKHTIEKALRAQDDEASNAWESQLLSKGSGHFQHPPNTPKLPKLHPTENENGADGSTQLSQAIASVVFRKSQLMKQLATLKSQKTSLQAQQEALTHDLHQWPRQSH